MRKPIRLSLGVALMLACVLRAVAGDSRFPIANNRPSYVPADWQPLLPGRMLHLQAVLALRNTGQLAKLEAELQDRDSPRYHRWLTTEQFVARFGPTPRQMTAVAQWLTSQGLRVTAADIRKHSIQFSGAAAAVSAALQTPLVGDDHHYANTTDPMVPAELAPVITAILGLSSREEVANGAASRSLPGVTLPGVGTAFGPSDLYTFYDLNPLITAGNRGTASPDCIAMIEGQDANDNALAVFNSQFGLPPTVLTRVLVDGANPGLGAAEPFLDAEWAHTVAPNTPIVFYLGGIFNDLAQAVADNRCGVVTSSVSLMCPDVPSILAYNSLLAQAVVQVQTVFHAAGDFGANWPCGQVAPTEPPVDQSKCGLPKGATFSQPSVDDENSSPYITVVGGTMFDPVYDAAGHDVSVIGDNLETAWNEGKTGPDHCPVKDSTGGGKSSVFPKPSWQKGVGVPDDRVRDIPDIALGADGKAPGFFIASCKELPCAIPDTVKACPDKGKVCFGAGGGTSIASPMWAGLSRLIAHAQGVTRLGNINPRLYELGNLQKPALGLHDITVGNNDDNHVRGYDAGPGFDLVSGWGTADFAKLVAAFPGASATTSPATVTVGAGATANAGQFTVTNTTGALLTLSAVRIAVSSPDLFSKLALTAAGAAPVAAVPASSTLFTLGSVAIPAGGSATFTLQATAATLPAEAALTQSRSGPCNMDSIIPWSVVFTAILMLALARLAGRATVRGCGVALVLIAAAALWAEGCASDSGIAFHPQASSTQKLAQGSIALSDGQGGIIEVSGLPASLGTVTARF